MSLVYLILMAGDLPVFINSTPTILYLTTNSLNEPNQTDNEIDDDVIEKYADVDTSLDNQSWSSKENIWSDPVLSSDKHENTIKLERKKANKMRKLQFWQSVSVVLIPSIKEYKEADITRFLWWKDEDYSQFKREATAEIRAAMCARACSVKEASLMLYQPVVNSHADDGLSVGDARPPRILQCVPLPSSDNSNSTSHSDKENTEKPELNISSQGPWERRPRTRSLMSDDPNDSECSTLDAFVVASIVSPQRIAGATRSEREGVKCMAAPSMGNLQLLLPGEPFAECQNLPSSVGRPGNRGLRAPTGESPLDREMQQCPIVL